MTSCCIPQNYSKLLPAPVVVFGRLPGDHAVLWQWCLQSSFRDWSEVSVTVACLLCPGCGTCKIKCYFQTSGFDSDSFQSQIRRLMQLCWTLQWLLLFFFCPFHLLLSSSVYLAPPVSCSPRWKINKQTMKRSSEQNLPGGWSPWISSNIPHAASLRRLFFASQRCFVFKFNGLVGQHFPI